MKQINCLTDQDKWRLWNELKELGAAYVASKTSKETAEEISTRTGLVITATNVITACEVLGMQTKLQIARNGCNTEKRLSELEQKVAILERKYQNLILHD